MKAPTRIRDNVDGQICYRWVESGPLEHYRHAHAFDHIGAEIARRNPPAACAGSVEEERENYGLLGDYDHCWFN